MFEPVWNRNNVACVQITMAEELRGRGPRPLLRPGRRAAGCRRQPPDAGDRRAAMEPPAGRDARPLKDAMFAVFSAMPKADPKRTTCAGSTRATARSTGVAKGSTTETYAAARFEIDNWRWEGVPFFIRTGKLLPVTQRELRLIFKRPPRLGFQAARKQRPEPDQLVIKLHPTHRDPAAGRRPAQRRRRARADQSRHGVRPGGRRGPDAVRGAAARRDAWQQHALQTPGQHRADLADRAAAARQAPRGPSVQAGFVGPEGRRQARRRLRRLARAVGRRQ